MSKKTTAEKILHSILISSDILTWNPQGEIVYHGRDIPGANIENLLQYALLPYNSHIPEPRGFDQFTKGLVEAGINKDLIKNEYLLSKMAKDAAKLQILLRFQLVCFEHLHGYSKYDA